MQLDALTFKRRSVSMTSLIDVIFLLLLFFMLSSTFSNFSDVELQTSGGSGAADANTNPLFVTLDENRVLLNGQPIEPSALKSEIESLKTSSEFNLAIVSVLESVSAQDFVSTLTTLQSVSALRLQIVR